MYRLATTSNTTTAQLADTLTTCDPIDGISVPTNNTVTAVTDFINEACDEVNVRSLGVDRLPEMYTDTTTVTDIRDYFSRPKLLNTITYSSTTRGSLATYECSALNTQNNMYNFSPYENTGLRSRLSAITPVSQLPGVNLDLAETTSVVLKIPFIHSNNYFVYNNVLAYAQTLGYLGVFAMTPYTAAAGVAAPKLALWHWLEDFELVGASPYEVAALTPGTTRFEEDFTFVDLPPTPYESQMAPPRNASSREGAAIPGNLSNVLSAGSNLTRWVSTRVPSLSAVAGSASWFLRESAKVAASYGWSRPISTVTPNKVINSMNIHQNNCDGADPSFNLGLFSENAINTVSGFAGTDVDEMAFANLVGVPAVINVGDLTVSTIAGTYLKCIELCPLAMWFQTEKIPFQPDGVNSPANGQSFWPAPVMGVANLFAQWRGSFKFTVRMAKTKFHTGRVLLGYVPKSAGVGAVQVPSEPTLMNFKSVIWDLREANEVEFICPFICPISYLPYNAASGTFFMVVLEPLAAPTTVSQNCPFIVEVSGCDDFDFAKPMQARDRKSVV